MNDPKLSGKWVRLRIITPDDVDALHALMIQPPNLWRWVYHGRTPPLAEFSARLFDNPRVLAQFAVLPVGSDEIVGFVVADQVDASNGHAHVSAVLAPGWIDKVAGLEAAALLIDYCFSERPFRKLYIEATDYTMHGLDEFDEEGSYREHVFHAGQWWDLHVYAVWREKWMNSTIRAWWQRQLDGQEVLAMMGAQ